MDIVSGRLQQMLVQLKQKSSSATVLTSWLPLVVLAGGSGVESGGDWGEGGELVDARFSSPDKQWGKNIVEWAMCDHEKFISSRKTTTCLLNQMPPSSTGKNKFALLSSSCTECVTPAWIYPKSVAYNEVCKTTKCQIPTNFSGMPLWQWDLTIL